MPNQPAPIVLLVASTKKHLTRHPSRQDKRMIHDLVVGEMQSFDHIDRVLKKSIGEALTECEKSVSRQFSDARLKKKACFEGWFAEFSGSSNGHVSFERESEWVISDSDDISRLPSLKPT